METPEEFWFLKVGTGIVAIVLSGIFCIWMLRRSGSSMGRREIETITFPESPPVSTENGEITVHYRKSFFWAVRMFSTTVTIIYAGCLFTALWP